MGHPDAQDMGARNAAVTRCVKHSELPAMHRYPRCTVLGCCLELAVARAPGRSLLVTVTVTDPNGVRPESQGGHKDE